MKRNEAKQQRGGVLCHVPSCDLLFVAWKIYIVGVHVPMSRDKNPKAKHKRQNAVKCDGSAMGSSGALFTVDHG